MPPLALDPRRTAFLFIDYQVDVCAAGGRMVSQEPAVLERFGAARANAARLLEALRRAPDDARPLVIHICHRFEPGYPELAGRPANGMARAVLAQQAFVTGSAGAAFVPELAPRHDELVLAKTSIAPFETTDLAVRLQRHGIDTLVVSGVVTHYAVLAAGVAGNDRGYRVLVAVDACAAGDPARHEAALAILRPLVELVSADDLVAACT